MRENYHQRIRTLRKVTTNLRKYMIYSNKQWIGGNKSYFSNTSFNISIELVQYFNIRKIRQFVILFIP